MTKGSGTVALVGGDEWTEPCTTFDTRLLEFAGTDEVLVLPTAAAFEHPDRAVERATRYFEGLGARVTGLPVLNRRDAEADANVSAVRVARFVYVADGSPLHLRSVLKGSAFYDALAYAYGRGAVIAASGAGATVLGDPMVDPRGGAYTVGLGLVPGLAIFPYHGRAAEHLRERSVDLLARDAILVGIDEMTALVRTGDDPWDVMGAGGATVYRKDAKPKTVKSGAQVELGAGAAATRP
ncbi:MAG TPA: Type 1 glutamine amidotransferase-like domain-containing protein [Acidimicrobiia bacterium]|nr:Type 1 glutamine amidotransferase-like domain-containing protein [Acidimicrobiia bacterium]